jgi:hypothetical protein
MKFNFLQKSPFCFDYRTATDLGLLLVGFDELETISLKFYTRNNWSTIGLVEFYYYFNKLTDLTTRKR